VDKAECRVVEDLLTDTRRCEDFVRASREADQNLWAERHRTLQEQVKAHGNDLETLKTQMHIVTADYMLRADIASDRTHAAVASKALEFEYEALG